VVLFAIYAMASLEEEEDAEMSLPPPEWVLPSSTIASPATLGIRSVSLAIERGVGAVQQGVNGKVKD
jgi:hypothetical protein